MGRGRRHHRHRKNFRRRNHHDRKRNFLNINPQIFNGLSFIILGILLIRFSSLIFVQWFAWSEGIFWGYLIGVGLIIGGLFSLIAWWRNNVSMFTTKHRVRWNS